MSMSMHLVGIKPADETWKKMKDVWDACDSAGIKVPDSVLAFFKNEPPDDDGVTVDLSDDGFDWKGDMEEGYTVILSDLDPTIKKLRFYCSW